MGKKDSFQLPVSQEEGDAEEREGRRRNGERLSTPYRRASTPRLCKEFFFSFLRKTG